jgi:hypothetical protein
MLKSLANLLGTLAAILMAIGFLASILLVTLGILLPILTR